MYTLCKTPSTEGQVSALLHLSTGEKCNAFDYGDSFQDQFHRFGKTVWENISG